MAEQGMQLVERPKIEATSATAVTVLCAPRTLTMRTVTDMELDSVASLGNSVNLTFFGLCCGALIAFGVALATISITDPVVHASFVALAAVSLICTLYFGVRAIIDYRDSRKRLASIKNNPMVGV